MLDVEKYYKPKTLRVIHPESSRDVEVMYTPEVVSGYEVRILDPDIHKAGSLANATQWALTYNGCRNTVKDFEIDNNPFNIRIISHEQTNLGYLTFRTITSHRFIVDIWSEVFAFTVFKYGISAGGYVDTSFVFARNKSNKAKIVTILPVKYFDEQLIEDVLT